MNPAWGLGQRVLLRASVELGVEGCIGVHQLDKGAGDRRREKKKRRKCALEFWGHLSVSTGRVWGWGGAGTTRSQAFRWGRTALAPVCTVARVSGGVPRLRLGQMSQATRGLPRGSRGQPPGPESAPIYSGRPRGPGAAGAAALPLPHSGQTGSPKLTGAGPCGPRERRGYGESRHPLGYPAAGGAGGPGHAGKACLRATDLTAQFSACQ